MKYSFQSRISRLVSIGMMIHSCRVTLIDLTVNSNLFRFVRVCPSPSAPCQRQVFYQRTRLVSGEAQFCGGDSTPATDSRPFYFHRTPAVLLVNELLQFLQGLVYNTSKVAS